MHSTTFALTVFLLLPLAFAKAIPAPIASRDDGSTVVAYVSAYTGDNCDSPPINDLVIGFEASSENICVGNGTAAHGVYVRALHSGCVFNVFTNADCTGLKYGLDQIGCYILFEADDQDVGIRGLSVTCNEPLSVASASASAGASASASAGGSAKPSASSPTSYGNYTGMGMKKLK